MSPLKRSTEELEPDIIGGAIAGKDDKLDPLILHLALFYQGAIHGLHAGYGGGNILKGTVDPRHTP